MKPTPIKCPKCEADLAPESANGHGYRVYGNLPSNLHRTHTFRLFLCLECGHVGEPEEFGGE